jgi:two-component system response regulator AtoC
MNFTSSAPRKAVSSEYPLNFLETEIEQTAPVSFEDDEKPKQELHDIGNIVTSSPEVLRILAIARRAANTDVPVLILGESGVGKELVAQFLHEQSNRYGHPFVKVNCAALPHDLLESELFGYEKGAFTGAVQDRIGRFKQADHGTLFLDEIGEMSPHLQAKLLHVLQDGEFNRLGSRVSTKVNVRIVAATNRKLKEAVRRGEFRSDLYFRLNVIQLNIPPLRDRREDIALLANHFLEKYRERYGSSQRVIPTDVMDTLIEREWPGNVRQLENVVKRYLILNRIDAEFDDFDEAPKNVTEPANALDLKSISMRVTEQAERDIVVRVLNETEWNRKECAKRLHISYKALRNKLKRWNLRPAPKSSSPFCEQHSGALDQLD